MRTLIFLLISFVTGSLAAQTPVMQSFAVAPGQKILFQFDYPELIKITTWEKNEISITGNVSINDGDSDDAFKISQSTSGNVNVIEGKIHNLKQLPQRITITTGEKKITFRTKTDFEKYRQEHGRNFSSTSYGVDIKITLEIKVPRNMETEVKATYGMVEVRDFTGSLAIDATYGGIDAAIQTNTTGELTAETNYGQIYSNLDVKFGEGDFEDFHTRVSVSPGKGPRYSFESKYGNVYLRKPL